MTCVSIISFFFFLPLSQPPRLLRIASSRHTPEEKKLLLLIFHAPFFYMCFKTSLFFFFWRRSRIPVDRFHILSSSKFLRETCASGYTTRRGGLAQCRRSRSPCQIAKMKSKSGKEKAFDLYGVRRACISHSRIY